ncbi:MAG: hypothetical protein KBC27_02275 [Rickettsiales bacterium]|nr:hypothetical protein [Rickettsiales bacterium]
MRKHYIQQKDNHSVAAFVAFLIYVFPGVYLFAIALIVLAVKFSWF